jgi:hypothetical protein
LDSQSEESPLGAATGPVLDPDERRELGRLRGEVAALRATPAPRRARFRWASRAAAVLLVLDCVGVPASVLAVWTHNQLADGERERGQIAVARARTRRRVWQSIQARHGWIPPSRVADVDLGKTVVIRMDATIQIAHSDKEGAAGTFSC